MKKSSLNLSVNAIIIFVLAFAMLGVGLLVTNQLEGLGMGGINKAKDMIKNIDEDPSALKPLVGISKELTMPARKELPLGLKYYNTDQNTIANPFVDISICKDTTDPSETPLDYPLDIVSLADDIDPSSFESIPVTLKNKQTGGVIGGHNYICKLEIKGDIIPPTGTPQINVTFYTHSFHLTVES